VNDGVNRVGKEKEGKLNRFSKRGGQSFTRKEKDIKDSLRDGQGLQEKGKKNNLG